MATSDDASAGQDYFWTSKWQENERIADEEIACGDVHRFTDVDEAIRWLREA